jgi:opacity protein-like surface antigen
MLELMTAPINLVLLQSIATIKGRGKMRSRLALIPVLILLSANAALAQKHELAFTSGGLKIGERGFDLPRPGRLKFGTGFTYEVNYARRFFDGKIAALYIEFPFASTPRTKVVSTDALSPRSYSSIFFAPGVKLKLLPGAKYSPYALMGVGLARFNESSTRINDQPNTDQSSKVHNVFDFGAGLDVHVFSILSIRGEVRDFYSELPPLNVSALRNRQHNALISAGFVVRF